MHFRTPSSDGDDQPKRHPSQALEAENSVSINPSALRLHAGDVSVAPEIVDNTYRFDLRTPAKALSLMSNYALPREGFSPTDQRILGVPVIGVRVDGEPLPLGSEAFRLGWWPLEGPSRWTNGSGQLVLAQPAHRITIELDAKHQLNYRPERVDLPPDQQIVTAFESLGDNCELGIVQRRLGVEPLGLLRFAGMRLPQLVRGLQERFDGINDPAQLSIRTLGTEFMIGVGRYRYQYHSGVHVGQGTPEDVLAAQITKLAYQRRALMECMEDAEKLFVFRQNEPVSQDEIEAMVAEVRRYGPCSLLWVVEHDEGHEPGTVVMVADGLMKGFIERLASRENAASPSVEAWLLVLRRAYEKWIGPAWQDGYLLRPDSGVAG